MNAKTILIALLAIVLVGGFFVFNEYIFNLQQDDEGELCAQVLTDARNPATGEIETFPTPCDVPDGWDILGADL